MTVPSTLPTSAAGETLAAAIGARSVDSFVGRVDVMQMLLRAGDDLARGHARVLVLAGASGAGKSELLRRAVAHLPAGERPVFPIYLDMGMAEEKWNPIEAALTQAVAFISARHGMQRRMPEGDPSRMAALLLEAGLGRLAPLIERSRRGDALASFWPVLADGLRTGGLPPAAILCDGLADASPSANAAARQLCAAAIRTGHLFVCEAPGAGAAPLAAEQETLSLPPLSPEEAATLLARPAAARGWALAPAIYGPILARLGPYPGLLHAWAAQISARQAATATAPRNAIRLAEEAYLALVSDSAWSTQLRRRFEAAVPLERREAALRLVQVAAEASTSLHPADAIELIGASQGEATLQALVQLGLLRVSAVRCQGPTLPALSHWAELMLDDGPVIGPAESLTLQSPARLAMLARHLAIPRASADTPETETPPLLDAAFEQLIPHVLTLFSRQALPEVLFQFNQYHEALGRLTPGERRAAINASKRKLHLPEVIGVSPLAPTQAPAVAAALTEAGLFVARAYAEGKYQRSHEQVWLVANLAHARVMTSPELEQALAAFRRAEHLLGPNRYVHWIILGQGASPEVLELLRRERIYCSNREQLELLRDQLEPAPPRRLPQDEAPAAPSIRDLPLAVPSSAPAHGDTPATPPHRSGVIEMKDTAPPPREQSTMRLAAREGSEYIAALMAEKLALRGGFEAIAAGRIKTAVLEGVLNAVEHSPNPEKQIDVQFRFTEDRMEIVIENEGSSFDPLAVPAPDPRAKLTASNKRGWGISLMKQFMDEVAYDPCTSGTRLRLVKRRGSDAASAPSAPQSQQLSRAFSGKAQLP